MSLCHSATGFVHSNQVNTHFYQNTITLHHEIKMPHTHSTEMSQLDLYTTNKFSRNSDSVSAPGQSLPVLIDSHQFISVDC